MKGWLGSGRGAFALPPPISRALSSSSLRFFWGGRPVPPGAWFAGPEAAGGVKGRARPGRGMVREAAAAPVGCTESRVGGWSLCFGVS